MKSRILKTTLAICLVITGATCAFLTKGLFLNNDSKDKSQASKRNNNSQNYDSVTVRKPQETSPTKASPKPELPDHWPDEIKSQLDNKDAHIQTLDTNHINDLINQDTLKQIAETIELSEEEQKALLTLLNKYNKLSGDTHVSLQGVDIMDEKAKAKLTKNLSQLIPEVATSKPWYSNQDFLLDAPSVLGLEKGNQLLDKANKLDYLDRDTKATQQVNSIQRNIDLTDQEAKSLKDLYFEHPSPTDQQLGQILPEDKVQKVKQVNLSPPQEQVIELQ